MLGSAHDAEDAVQETLLKAWRALPEYEGRSALGTWLYRIATNVCLDAIRRRPKRVLPVDYEDGAEWIEPFPDGDSALEQGPAARYEQREALELAFVAALQHLPAQQRAVLILRDVLGFSSREVSAMLETSVASVNSALQRARWGVEERLPERSQQVALRSLGDERVRALVERFVEAFERGDVEAILDLLAEDATFAMPPCPNWSRGRGAVAQSWLIPSEPGPPLRYMPTSANGQVSVGVYRLDESAGAYLPVCLDVLALDEDGITEVVAFRAVQDLSRFRLPDKLPVDAA